jgi:hypothetical protein
MFVGCTCPSGFAEKGDAAAVDPDRVGGSVAMGIALDNLC